MAIENQTPTGSEHVQQEWSINREALGRGYDGWVEEAKQMYPDNNDDSKELRQNLLSFIDATQSENFIKLSSPQQVDNILAACWGIKNGMPQDKIREIIRDADGGVSTSSAYYLADILGMSPDEKTQWMREMTGQWDSQPSLDGQNN